MRKLLLSGVCAFAVTAFAQTEQPKIIDKFTCQEMSGNGQWMLGRSNTWFYQPDNAYYTETSVYNVETGEIFGLEDLFTLTPYSRPISNKGVAILSNYEEATDFYETLYLIVPGQEPKMLKQFYEEGPYKGFECYAGAITDDATAFLAYYEQYPKQYPFVCSLSESYEIGEPVFLPLPEKDIFGLEPFSVQLTAISNDANTVAGIVVSEVPGAGTICYPIVYSKNEKGDWSYSYPMLDMYDVANPDNCPRFYQYQIALSPDGSKLACTQEVPNKVSNFPIYVVWTIDLKDGKATKIESKNPDIVATQILDDGTVTGTYFATIKISYIFTPGAADFIDFAEYAAKVNPEYGKWFEENRMVDVKDYDDNGQLVDKRLPDTGQVYVSNDLKTIASGFQTSQLDEYANPVRWSYVFTDFEPSGIYLPTTETKADKREVYNLMGLKVATLRNGEDVNSLPAGLYIVDGKKILVNK